MSLTFAIFTFINVWWVTLFMVLPFGIKMNKEKTTIEYAAAPQPPRWKKLIIINSCISLLITLVLALLINNNVVPLKNLGS